MAKQIRLTKINELVRFEENDSSDDGNYFRGYMYKDFLPVHYLRADGYVYISIRFDYISDLNYEDYSKFDSYKESDSYNGIVPEGFSYEEFERILGKCYNEAKSFIENVEDVNEDELFEKVQIVNEGIKENNGEVLTYIENRSTAEIFKLSKYQFSELKGYYERLQDTQDMDYILTSNQANKRKFLEADTKNMINSKSQMWTLKYIKKMFEK